MIRWPAPFKLSEARVIDQPGLPTELRQFYERHEGLSDYYGMRHGELMLGSSEVDDQQAFAIYKLEEVSEYPRESDRKYWLGAWSDFRGVHIGQSSFLDAIVCVTGGHQFPVGTIVAHGFDVAGPLVDGRPMLVLGRSLADWFAYLERHGWEEWGMVPGGIGDLAELERDSVLAHFRERNPGLDW